MSSSDSRIMQNSSNIFRELLISRFFWLFSFADINLVVPERSAFQLNGKGHPTVPISILITTFNIQWQFCTWIILGFYSSDLPWSPRWPFISSSERGENAKQQGFSSHVAEFYGAFMQMGRQRSRYKFTQFEIAQLWKRNMSAYCYLALDHTFKI